MNGYQHAIIAAAVLWGLTMAVVAPICFLAAAGSGDFWQAGAPYLVVHAAVTAPFSLVWVVVGVLVARARLSE